MVHRTHSFLEPGLVSVIPNGPTRKGQKFSILLLCDSFLENFLYITSPQSRKPAPLWIRAPNHLQVRTIKNSMCTILFIHITSFTEGRCSGLSSEQIFLCW
ncbi:hypothetical protein ACJW30_12G047000 [Castanea mollissima]